jgi:peptidoglycan/xylan/chitin deacetylase (PgdA/CDA1 family)
MDVSRGSLLRLCVPTRLATALRICAALVLIAVFVAGTNSSVTTKGAGAAPGQTIVSLTFDDGSGDQFQGLAPLNAHGMHATYYLNSPRIDSDSAYMTWAQVAQLSAAGNEIGGHTAYHADLPVTDPTEAQRQICYDRDNLLARGYQATDFAYPYGHFTPAVKQMVQNCGYNSARTTDEFPQSNPSGQIPPPDPYQINVGTDTTTVSAMQAAVTAAKNNGGGWVPITFHHICNACDVNYITLADFKTFLDWLQGQAGNGVVVRTMQNVLGGSVQPAVPGPGLPPAPNGTNALRNASLEQDTNGDSVPDCWENDDFGNNNFTWTRTSDAHSGSFAERLDVTNYHDGDNKLLVNWDLGYCMPSVNEGHRYRITEWYKSNSPVFFTLWSRNSQWEIRYLTSSDAFPASSTWTQATFITDPIPAGINGLSFGLTLGSNGSLTVDDASFDDASASGGSDTTPPTVSLTSPTAGATVSGFVPISATATDNIGIDHVDYLIDGNVANTRTTPPFTYNWNSRTVANGFHNVAVRAVDLAGNSTTTNTISVFVSNQTNNLLQNPSLEQGSANPPNCWLLGGFGTNTFAWTWTADAHTGTHAENLNITSYTNGDRKLLTNFSSACSPAVTPGHSYTITVWYKAPAPAKPVIFAFSNTTGGNGAYNYWSQSAAQPSTTGWTQATWSTPVVPAGVTNISVGMGMNGLPSTGGQVTMDDFGMFDNAPQPDTTPPTSAIGCNGGGGDGDGCASGYYNGPVEVDLFASDEPGGSGVARIVYTTDGSDPTATHGTNYSGPFSVGQTTTVKARAIDVAGNVEPTIHSQLIQIDTLPPTASIACNGNPCGAGVFNNTVSLTMSGTDQGGSGVSQIIYTTDGSTPSLTNGNTYLGAFSVNTSTTIKYIAVDGAGNLSSVFTQPITIDTVAPTSTISCNGGTCQSAPYGAGVQVSLSASDVGSGVAVIRYTTDGTIPTLTNGIDYLAPFMVAATATVRYRAFDNAGNAEATHAQLITIDSTPPTVTLTAPAGGATISGQTTLQATASDNVAVDHVEFLVDGNQVGSDSSAPYTLSWDSRTVSDGLHNFSARAVDTAGNQATSSENQATVLNGVDSTPPTSTISCNDNACTSAPYSDPVAVTLAASDNPGGSGVAEIRYTTDGTTPTLTNGETYVAAFTVSATTTVKYRAFDVAGNAEAVHSQLITIGPTSISLTAPPDGSTVGGTVTLSASVSGATPDHVDFLVDGTNVGTAASTPWSVDWDSTSVADGQHTIVARALDANGNTLDTSPLVTVTVQQQDTTAPTSTINCNSGDCGGWFNAAVTVTLAASDNPGGSGVASIRYTTDGTTPTSTNGFTYGSPFVVGADMTIKYRAFDNAGNAEAVNSQPIQIDTVAPTSSIQCNGTNCSGSYYNAAVTVTLSAGDVGGSGIDKIVYTTDGSTPTSSNGTVYSGAFTLGQTTTVKYRAFDVAANAEPVNSALLRVDTTAPATSINCNGAACVSGSWYRSGVSISLASNDADSGVAQIRYTTNGTVPTKTTGTIYTGPFTLSATTTINYRAFDNAGNLEPNNVFQVQVDGTAPTASLTAPSAGALVAGPTTLSANAGDNVAVDHVDFLVDGNIVGSDSIAPYAITWDSAAVADGQHSITARAVDSAGNQTTSSPTSVIVTNVNLLQNPGLEQGSGNTPNCWILGGYGTNTFTWTWTTDAHSGTHAENLNITSYTNGDRKMLNAFNGTCSIATQAGRVYTVSAWYKSTARPAFFAFSSTTGPTGAYNYLAQSPQQQISAGWAQATWTTPPMPAGTTNLSIGMGLSGQAGSVTMDDFGAFRTG